MNEKCLKTIIMAGGKGTRISQLFPNIPKPLIPITDASGVSYFVEDTPLGNAGAFDSLINISNNQLHGHMRAGMSIMDKDIEDKATEVILKWIQL